MDPDNLAALRDLSRGLVQVGRLDEAAAAAAKASAVAPWSARALVVEADVEFRRGRNQRALELVDRALAVDGRFLEARLDRTRYLAASGRTDEATAELERLLEEAPDNNWVALRYAELVELAAGDVNAAEHRLRAVLSRNHSFDEAWLLLGTVLTRAGRTADAIAAYREAIADGNAGPDLQARLALLLAKTGDPAAETALRDAIRSSPVVRADLHVTLAELLAAHGRRQEARQQLELAAAAPAGPSGSRNDTAKALLLLGRTAEAESVWREMIASDPDAWRARLNLAALAIQRGNWQKAEQLARAAVATAPTSADGWNTLAIALDELGRTSEAEASYRRAVQLDVSDWRALFNLGILLRESKRYAEAAAVQQEVLDRAPAHAGANFELGVLYAGPLGDPERARHHLEAAIRADPDHPRARQAQAILDRLP